MELTQIDYLSMIRIDCSIWSARAKIRPEDLPASVAQELPPDAMATLGTKRLFNPAKMKIFFTLYARAKGVLDKKCVRFLGGWATHEERLPELAVELAAIADEFNQEKQQFLDSYVYGVAEWAANFPEWSHILLSSVPKVHDIQAKFRFSWQAFKIAPQDSLNGFAGNDLNESLSTLEQGVVDELAKSMAEIHKECFAGKNSMVKSTGSRPLKTLIDKVRALGFIHPHLVGFEQVLNELMIMAYPSQADKAMDPQSMALLKNFLLACGTPQGIQAICQDFCERNKTLPEVLDPFWMVGGVQTGERQYTEFCQTHNLPEQVPLTSETCSGLLNVSDTVAIQPLNDQEAVLYDSLLKDANTALVNYEFNKISNAPAENALLDGGGLW